MFLDTSIITCILSFDFTCLGVFRKMSLFETVKPSITKSQGRARLIHNTANKEMNKSYDLNYLHAIEPTLNGEFDSWIDS